MKRVRVGITNIHRSAEVVYTPIGEVSDKSSEARVDANVERDLVEIRPREDTLVPPVVCLLHSGEVHQAEGTARSDRGLERYGKGQDRLCLRGRDCRRGDDQSAEE